MPAQAAMTTHEGEMLASYVVQQLNGVRAAAYGLTDEQVALTPTTSSLSVGGLVKHVTSCATGWLDRAFAAPGTPPEVDPEAARAAYGEEFTVTAADSAASLLAGLEAVIARVEKDVPGLDLTAAVPVPDAPWFPKDLGAWNVRWVLLHLVEEVARHAGHADIIREAIDGATMYELLAGLEGWPETPWLKPWQPATV
ncbi:DinB family protein [Luteipulveratus halotolerans]|uniref:DinB family protein n=1 Tax=Luteipulveratus halotolerans TaxID=1631356 RepID=A0A0L6CKR3_9MICO|nr:DinB family protein [Luteipulveratus halotolerans]KNX38319.1 hypothetical protein VV01_16090 [Luteipulveratus halotolerans]